MTFAILFVVVNLVKAASLINSRNLTIFNGNKTLTQVKMNDTVNTQVVLKRRKESKSLLKVKEHLLTN